MIVFLCADTAFLATEAVEVEYCLDDEALRAACDDFSVLDSVDERPEAIERFGSLEAAFLATW